MNGEGTKPWVYGINSCFTMFFKEGRKEERRRGKVRGSRSRREKYGKIIEKGRQKQKRMRKKREAKELMQRCSKSATIREIQIKMIVRYHFISFREAVI